MVLPDDGRSARAGGVALLAARGVRCRITPAPMEGDEASWWAANLRCGLVLWALGEAVGTLGAVGYLLTADYVVAGALGGTGLFVLLRHRPARLIQG